MTVMMTAPATSRTIRATLPEEFVAGKPLGRHVHHDPRSWDYPAQRSARLISVNHGSSGVPLTQADEHSCSTAHSLCAAVNCSPGLPLAQADEHSCSTAHSLCAAVNCSSPGVAPMQPLTERDAVGIYQRARAIDGASDQDTLPGSSGLMACKAAASLGLIRSYEHAFGLRHALEALVLRPVMTGFSWYTSFDSPDPDTGLVEITPAAHVRGGHEVVAHAIDTEAQIVWFWNSWGPEFGLGGRFCMTFRTWERLLGEQGDVTVPVL
jgi:hypothetical protein